MFGAFSRTSVTDRGTEPTNLFGKTTVSGHELDRQLTDIGAITTEFNTLAHVGSIRHSAAGRGAFFTFGETRSAGLHTGLILFGRHHGHFGGHVLTILSESRYLHRISLLDHVHTV